MSDINTTYTFSSRWRRKERAFSLMLCLIKRKAFMCNSVRCSLQVEEASLSHSHLQPQRREASTASARTRRVLWQQLKVRSSPQKRFNRKFVPVFECHEDEKRRDDDWTVHDAGKSLFPSTRRRQIVSQNFLQLSELLFWPESHTRWKNWLSESSDSTWTHRLMSRLISGSYSSLQAAGA